MNSLMDCPQCQETFEKPVILPCGHTLCKKHEYKLNETSKIMRCPACQLDHSVPSVGFPSNLLAESLIKRKFKQIDLGPEHQVAMKSFEDLKVLVDKFKRLRDNPELEINRVVGKLRHKIDCKREEAKKSLDDEALALISELDDYEAKCKSELATSLHIPAQTDDLVRSLEQEIRDWEDEYVKENTFERNIKRLKTFHADTIGKYKELGLAKEKIMKSIFTENLQRLQLKQKRFCQEYDKPLV